MTHSATSPSAPRPGISRRRLVATTAWSAPAVALASAAPAFAGTGAPQGSCGSQQYALDWSTDYTRIDHLHGRGSAKASDGTVVGFTVTSVAVGAVRPTSGPNGGAIDGNLTVPTYTVGGTRQRGLILEQTLHDRYGDCVDLGVRGNRQEVTIRFDRDVTDLRLTLSDIDSSGCQYWDRVEVVGLSGSVANPTYVTGSGASTSPWRACSNSQTVDNCSSAAGNVHLWSTGAIREFRIVYWNGQRNITDSSLQAVWLSNLTFLAQGC